MQQFNTGDILLGKYRVEEIIGVGGMGRVIKANHLYLQQPVAIKILLPQMAESQSTVARFLREAQATVRLRSEHIARVMDVGTMTDGVPFMVMEYLEGHDLNQILRHHGPQMPQAVVDLILQACEGMAEAHAIGIVHRDIKPSNFFITRRPDGSNLLKILDFGISKTPAELSELTGAQTVIGTPTYMAPEQMVSARSTDPRSDIWSMGVVMYQLLAGRPPFEAETYAQLVLKVGTDAPAPLHVALPGGLNEIVMRCLEKKPENRIQSVGELARVLAPYASDPMSAQQSAERASRILTTPRGAQPGFPLAGSAPGGLQMPPPALTPRSWSQTNGSSLSGGAGQVGTKVTRKGRGLVIATVASMCIAAGVGGFIVASAMKKDGPKAAARDTVRPMPRPAPTAVTPPPPPPPPAVVAPPPSAVVAPPPSAVVKPAVVAPAPAALPTVTEPPLEQTADDPETKPVATKPASKKSTTAKSTKSSTPKTATKATTTKATTTKATTTNAKSTKSTTKATTTTKSTTTKSTNAKSTKSADDDLFDDRK